MSRNLVEEASACTIRARFFDQLGAAVSPSTLRYRLRDVTNCRTIVDWTDLTPGSYVDIPIDAQSNAIYNACNPYEDHALTVQANYGTDTQFADEIRYAVQNLKGFQ